MTDGGHDVRKLLAREAERIELPPSFSEQVDADVRSRRADSAGRRRRWIAVVASGVAAAVLTILVVGVIGGESGRSDAPPVGDPTPTELIDREAVGRVDPMEWARDLPQGSAPRLPYLLGGTLLDGATAIQVPGDAGFHGGGRVDGGWMLLFEHVTPGGRFWSRNGILRSSGEIDPLPVPQGSRGSLYPEAVSPDGSLVTYRGIVTDVRTFEIVGYLPEDASYVYGWSPRGIVYDSDNSRKQMLWQLGEEPRELSAEVGVVMPQTSRVLTGYERRCGVVADVLPDGTVVPEWEGCNDDRPVALSTDGERAVLADGDILTVASQAQQDGPTIPPAVLYEGQFDWQPVWESPDAYLVTIQETDDRNGALPPDPEAVVVRCSVPDAECERAGDSFQVPPQTDVTFDFFAS